MTISDCYNEFILKLSSIYEKSEATNISDWVLENITGIKRLQRVTDKHRQLSDIQIIHLQNALSRLLTHEPVQYVLNEVWFYKMKFYVDNNVLIPRPETEELVSLAIDELKIKTHRSKILEVGTGSGCISIALKKNLPDVAITSVEVSESALTVANKNAYAHGCSIEFVQLNFLDDNQRQNLGEFDMIISNPPYIPLSEKSLLDKNVTAYEPHRALFTEDNDPFIFYKAIAGFGNIHLNTGGKILVEVHEKYAKEIESIFVQNHFKAEIKRDIYGRERMIRASK